MKRHWMLGTSIVIGAMSLSTVPAARADELGYLVNVTARPGYNFSGSQAALAYGYGICDKVNAGRSYAEVVGDFRSDFGTDDEFQASYLIGQAVDELCPAALWQLRRSAAHYRPEGT